MIINCVSLKSGVCSTSRINDHHVFFVALDRCQALRAPRRATHTRLDWAANNYKRSPDRRWKSVQARKFLLTPHRPSSNRDLILILCIRLITNWLPWALKDRKTSNVYGSLSVSFVRRLSSDIMSEIRERITSTNDVESDISSLHGDEKK